LRAQRYRASQSALRVGCTLFDGEVLINPDKTIETISARARVDQGHVVGTPDSLDRRIPVQLIALASTTVTQKPGPSVYRHRSSGAPGGLVAADSVIPVGRAL
jgi:hypothetical protein